MIQELKASLPTVTSLPSDRRPLMSTKTSELDDDDDSNV